MVDNITLNSGTGGATLATDDIAGVHYQLIKLGFGALDAFSIVTSSAGLPVAQQGNWVLAANSGVDVGDVTVNNGTGASSVPAQGAAAQDAAVGGNPVLMGGRASAAAPTDMSADGDAVFLWTTLKGALHVADGGGNLSVDDGGNVLSVDWNGTAPPIGAGTEAAALRVTLATDSTGVVSVDDNGGSLTVDNAALAVVGGGVEATALRVTVASDSTGVLSVDDTGGSLTIDNAQLSVVGGGTEAAAMRVTIANDSTGVLSVDDNGGSLTVDGTVTANLAAGTNNIGDVDVLSIAAGSNLIGNVGLGVRTSGGMTIFRSIDIDETEEEIKATAGQVYSIAAFNRTAAPLYLKFYNATAANVTVGTTTPVQTFVVPANADSDGAGFIFNNEIGYAFGTAITVAATTGVADNDTGAPGANDCVINVGYA